MENSNESSRDGKNLQRGPSPLLLALSDIKIAHSVFAMPFALLAAGLAAPTLLPSKMESVAGAIWQIRWLDFVGKLLLIVLCMVFARTWAMLVNRLADSRFDKANPRTAGRVFASARLTSRQGWGVALGSAGAFVTACAVFMFFGNPWPLMLALPVLAWIALYSYTKRFTAWCHVFLGSALAFSPISAAIAINPAVYFPDGRTALTDAGWAILLLSGFVLLWVAGFDVAYALQDIDFDRRTGLHSIPARVGARGALWVSRAFHAGAFALLVLAWRAEPRFGAIMLGAALTVGGLLVFEHVVLARRGVAGLPIAFFTVNGVVSCVLGAAGIADVLV